MSGVTSLKVSLKEILWPSFSVSTSTPSQSNRRAEGRTDAEQVILTFLMLIGFALLVRLLTFNFEPKKEDDDKHKLLFSLLLQLIVGM